MSGLPFLLAAAAAAAAESPAPTPVPKIPFSTISVFEPAGTRCEWRRIDPAAGTHVVLASFDGGCKLARVAWTADGSKAVVSIPSKITSNCSGSSPTSSCDDPPPREILLVLLAEGKVTTIPLPPVGAVREMAFDSKNVLIAVTLQRTEPSAVHDLAQAIRGKQGGSHWTIRSQRWAGTKWIMTQEADGPNFGPHPYTGKHVLVVLDDVGPRSGQLLGEREVGGHVLTLRREQLAASFPGTRATNGWQALPLTEGRAYHPIESDWEAHGPLVFFTGGAMVQAERSPSSADTFLPFACDRFVLLSARYTGSKPRFYDAEKAKLLYASDVGEGATLWPNPECPPSEEPADAGTGFSRILLPRQDDEALGYEIDFMMKARRLKQPPAALPDEK